MSTEIHPTAIIEPGAELEAGVTVGAYAYIGARVKIRKGSEVKEIFETSKQVLPGFS